VLVRPANKEKFEFFGIGKRDSIIIPRELDKGLCIGGNDNFAVTNTISPLSE
jgi:hypothetical protein